MMKWIDLSMPVFTGMPVYPEDPAVRIDPVLCHDEHQLQVSRLVMGSHTGTHLDAPLHYYAGGAAVDQLELDQLMTRALVVSCPGQSGQLLDLTRLDLSLYQPGDALLLHTGWDQMAGTDQYYCGMPLFAPGSTDFLLSLGIRLLGLDLPGACEYSEPLQPSAMHLALLGAGLVLVECLVGLGALAGRRVDFQALPLRLAGCDGSPVRACARVIV